MGLILAGAEMRARVSTPFMLAALSALVLLDAGAAYGQTGTVVGRVTDARSGQVVANARLEIDGTQLRAVTDPDGRYRVTNVPAGERTISVRRIGYNRGRQTLTVEADRDVTVDFALQPAPIALEQVVVTGTAGGEKLRTIGNSVATINAVEAVSLGEPPNFTSLLNARAPGLLLTGVTGRLGAVPSINIRGRSSLGQGNSPLIYIDGVRVNSATGQGAFGGSLGAQGSSVAGRLNDIVPEDIESIEVVKGPAASTIYGTDASTGVIQIITKKGAISAKPQFSMQVQHGSIYFRDADGRLPTNYLKIPVGQPNAGQVVAWNAIQQEKDSGRTLFRTGRTTSYNGALSGSKDQLRYYLSGAYSDESGVEPNNRSKQFSMHTNLSLAPTSKIDVHTSLHYVDLRNRLGTDQGASTMLGAMLGHPLIYPNSRGFAFNFPPELTWELWDNIEKSNRFTASGSATYRAFDWLHQRLLMGVDYTGGDNRALERFAPPEFAPFLTPTQRLGRIGQRLRRNINLTIDYAGTANASVTSSLTSASSIGLQAIRTESNTSDLGGMGFPAPGVETVSGAATPLTPAQSELLNTTVGAYVQEKFGWRDRLFVTGAFRVDNNSAFGEDFKWVTYPKADVSWVINEEPFWRWHRWVSALRLRAAYGQSGQAPQAFAALRTFTPIQGPGGTTAVTPGALGNPDLKPERGKELELGFDVTAFDRVSLDVTHFRKKTVDEIINQAVAPSSGFSGSVPLNLGRVDNSGWEVLATIDAFTNDIVDWDLVANFASNEDVIKDLGAVSGAVTTVGGANRVGFPIGGLWSKRVVSADRDPVTQLAINVMCDGGAGQPPVACTAAPFLYMGRPTPKTSGAVINTVTLMNRLRLYALVDYRRGHRRVNSDRLLRCTGAGGGQVCEENVFPDRFAPVVLAEVVGTAFNQGIVDQYFEDASFVKLREMSASYDLPRKWTPRVSSTSITLAARELATWTKFRGTDPENNGQAILPPLSRITATLNVRF